MSALGDVLAPYALVIRIALWALLAGGLFVTGCRHGEKTATAAAAEQISSANQSASDNLAAANACGLVLTEVTAETDKAKAAASALQAQAEQEAAQAAQDAAAAKAKASEAANALQAAKAMPTCAAQLAMTLCPEIPLL